MTGIEAVRLVVISWRSGRGIPMVVAGAMHREWRLDDILNASCAVLAFNAEPLEGWGLCPANEPQPPWGGQ